MSERVRVTGPPRRHAAARPGSRLGDVHEQTPLGDVYLRSLLSEQLGLAGRVLAAVALTLGLLPLLFHLAPDLAHIDVLGLPLAWVLLGVAVHPFLLWLGWRYVRRVERNERYFADLVGTDTGPHPEH
ncbi:MULTISPECIES: hypothetical protein [Nocardioides]|uniref:DUF485 domain-containing protein n=1 Tax=Nocardioides vastitatis TaxID=2568655 RepID=A0ABW0ZFX9_9ACTN|nr:hypothetical protein [Nocardioides sp.]THI94012.1 hypothetical protein E7Z54_20605 [Nocardioides sp.]